MGVPEKYFEATPSRKPGSAPFGKYLLISTQLFNSIISIFNAEERNFFNRLSSDNLNHVVLKDVFL